MAPPYFYQGTGPVVNDVCPNQAMQGPEKPITLTFRYEKPEPVQKDCNLETHDDQAVEYGPNMDVLLGVRLF